METVAGFLYLACVLLSRIFPAIGLWYDPGF